MLPIKSRWIHVPSFALIATGFLSGFAIGQDADQSVPENKGEQIYRHMCADCHGDAGQGVVGAYDRPMIGDLSIGQLAAEIEKTMPEDEPENCTGADAQAVAEYIHAQFYSEAAQLRLRPPQKMLSRLTAEQVRQSLSDLYAANDWFPRPENKHGVAAEYFKSDKTRKEDRVLERIDPVIDFDFGRESPGAGLPVEEFAINWTGALRVDQSGLYEIVVRSTCSFTLNLGRYDRTFIDNHVQSGDKTEFRETIQLTAGRVYPMRLMFIQRKRKTELPPAQVSVSWIKPGGVEQIIPAENWVPGWMPAQYAIQTALPPDDRSYGFERGIKVDRDWDAAMTSAAIEFGQVAAEEMWPDYQRKHKKDPNENRQQLRSFLRDILSHAFRKPVSDELATVFIDKQLEKEADDGQAIKRVLLIGLKSPRFLYPQADAEQTKSQRVGSRLGLCLMDSLPIDGHMQKTIDAGKLENEQQIREMAWHLIGDYRVRAKTQAMLYEWLNISNPHDRKKKPEQFAGFDDQVVEDLHRSLDQFLEDVVWSDSSDYRQLIQADWAYTTPRIQQYYGENWAPIEGFAAPVGPSETEVKSAVQTELKRTSNQSMFAGVLTHPYMLSGLAYFDSSSPIHRGIFILRNVFGRSLQPPADAAFAPLSPDLHPDLTTRERVTLQTSPVTCDTCHSRINSLGFALENWDASGRYRESEHNKPIDPSGHYINRQGEDVEFKNVLDLAKYAVSSADAHEAFVRRAFQHFVKQPPAAFGPNTLDQLTQKFVDSQFNIRNLLVEIAVVAATPQDPEQLAAAN